ncbi:hypothetical protein ACFQ07_24340 [Actinomadura adrarensis]|uniref:Uncharacterized protein n=1 Tax=Actinomadura adrarensis TaxID=1819600 RepID=A0ABW3CNV3_9ACTN
MLQPCFRDAGSKGVTAFVRVKSAKAAGTGGPVYVWTWVSRADHTKYRASLVKCRVSFTNNTRVATCGPTTFRPPAAGKFYASSDSAVENLSISPVWTSGHWGVNTFDQYGGRAWRP